MLLSEALAFYMLRRCAISASPLLRVSCIELYRIVKMSAQVANLKHGSTLF